MSFSSYPDYKDSGSEVMGWIPATWKLLALGRALAQPVTDGPHSTPEFVDEGVPFLSVDGIQEGKLVFDSCRYISMQDHEEFKKKAAPRYNDILMGKAASVGKIARVTDRKKEFNIWSPLALIRVDQTKYKPIYVEFCLKSNELQHQILLVSNSNTQLNIGMKDITKLRLAMPSLPEQRSIARFLDHETAKIDALIHEQKHLIELLQEKHQAVISHAVTKGLNPNVAMKDSGVEWLGTVPVHWIVGKIKWYLNTASGGTPPSSNLSEFYDGDIPWLRTLDLNNGEVDDYEVTVTQKAITETSCRIVPKGSVLIAMYGGDGTIGKHGLLRFDSAINQAICAFLPTKNILPKFLHFFVQFYRSYWMIGAESSRKDPNIGQDRIGDHLLIIPSLFEQQGIVQKLTTQLQNFEALSGEAAKLVKGLTERRSALISAAVTGKIDVRDWQPPADESAFDEEVHQAGIEAPV